MSHTHSDKTELKRDIITGRSSSAEKVRRDVARRDIAMRDIINQCLDEIAKTLDVNYHGCRSEVWSSVACVFNAGYNEGLEVNKPSETPMSKEEPMESPNPLPSSPTDKCREGETKKSNYPSDPINIMIEESNNECSDTRKDREVIKASIDRCAEEFHNHKSDLCSSWYDFWRIAWQASRKECEEEVKILKSYISDLQGEVDFNKGERQKAATKQQNAVAISMEHVKENEKLRQKLEFSDQGWNKEQNEVARLKQELQQAKLDAMPDWERMYREKEEELKSYKKCDEVLDGDPCATDDPTHVNISRLIKERREAQEDVVSMRDKVILERGMREELEEENLKLCFIIASLPSKEEFASLQSAITVKDEALKPFALASSEASSFGSVPNNKVWIWKPSHTNREAYGITIQDLRNAAAALQIDQSGGKKEEEQGMFGPLPKNKYNDGNLNTSTATPVSSHVPTAEEALEWLGYDDRLLCRTFDGYGVIHGKYVIGSGRTPLIALRCAMSKSKEENK